MKPVPSLALGFATAFAAAAGAVWLRSVLFPWPAEEASGGMAAFSDLLLFAGVLSLAAVVPTIRLLRLLSDCAAFWAVWSSVAVVVTLTGLVASAAYLAPGQIRIRPFPMIQTLAPLRLLGAAPLAIGFVLSAFLTPHRRAKVIFAGCAGIEIASFAAALAELILSRG